MWKLIFLQAQEEWTELFSDLRIFWFIILPIYNFSVHCDVISVKWKIFLN